MGDILKMLEHQSATHREAMKHRVFAAQEIRRLREDEKNAVEYRRVLAEQIDKLEAELLENDGVRQRMSDILRATADALHGGPLKDGYWSWHDLPELAGSLRRELAEAQQQLAEKSACVAAWKERALLLERELAEAREALELIAAPLYINGLDHDAAVSRARKALAAIGEQEGGK